jgi:GT2 family glycosyltransferase
MTAALSTVVVNYNADHFLRACVESLVNCPLDVQIIVVDNASTDKSLATIQSLPDVQIIQNSTNLGFATACNIGAQNATAPLLLFLNPDCYFEPGTLANLLDAMQAQADVGMVGGLLVNTDGTEQAGGRRAIPTPWRSFVRAFGLVKFAPRWPRLFFDFNLHQQALPDHPIEVEAISGACMLVRREAMQEVGPWDEGYFLHCEDLDLCMRFRQKNWKILFVPAARITHALGVCGRSRPLFVEWHKHKGMMRFYFKFFRHQYPGILMALVALGVWFRFALVVGYHTVKKLQQTVRPGRG